MDNYEILRSGPGVSFAETLLSLRIQLENYLGMEASEGRRAIFVRFFLSDAQNQAGALRAMLKSFSWTGRKGEQDLEDIPENVDELTDATGKLADGGKELYDGAGEFGSYLTQYISGGGQIGEGIGQLADGLQEFDQEAASELEKMAGDSLREKIAKIKGLRSADLAYDNFAGLSEGRTGSVRFIIETDEIK